ncbi:hypothetical protein Q5M85_03970 [Paraclostridium bifermentans]|nr:hypothetical protein [Paraclostridium bifermentans]
METAISYIYDKVVRKLDIPTVINISMGKQILGARICKQNK